MRTVLRVTVALFALAGTAGLGPGSVHAATLYGLVDTGELYASTDSGVTWILRSALPVPNAIDLTAGASAADIFLITESGEVYRSTDSGQSFSLVELLVESARAVLSMANLAHAFTEGLDTFRSTDGGMTFTLVSAFPAREVVSATRNLSTIFVLNRFGEVFRSSDEGSTWSLVGVAPPTSEAVEVRFFQGVLHVISESGELARSPDLGVTWSIVSTISQVGISGMASTPSELFAITTAGEVASTTTGLTWTWRGTIGQLTVRALATNLPASGGVEPGEAPPPPVLSLAAPWPNPSQDVVHLAIELAAPVATTVGLYNAAGRMIAMPFPEAVLPAGRTEIAWRPSGLARGQYWLRASAGGGDGGMGGDAARAVQQKLVWLSGR